MKQQKKNLNLFLRQFTADRISHHPFEIMSMTLNKI